MQINKMTVDIRPLPPYQAIDLGLSVARHWYGALIALWWRRALVVGVIITVLLLVVNRYAPDATALAYTLLGMVLWWLKPYFEAPLLLFLAKQLFDTTQSALSAEDWQKISLLKMMFVLVRHRLSLRRQSVLAVRLLEGQSGRMLGRRLTLLSRQNNSVHLMHTWVFVHLEWILYFGVFMVAREMLAPEASGRFHFDLLEQFLLMPLWFRTALIWLSMVCFGLIAPFFVASGFVMYLCKRSSLEAWDVELMFRRLADRYTQAQSSDDRYTHHSASSKSGHAHHEGVGR